MIEHHEAFDRVDAQIAALHPRFATRDLLGVWFNEFNESLPGKHTPEEYEALATQWINEHPPEGYKPPPDVTIEDVAARAAYILPPTHALALLKMMHPDVTAVRRHEVTDYTLELWQFVNEMPPADDNGKWLRRSDGRWFLPPDEPTEPLSAEQLESVLECDDLDEPLSAEQLGVLCERDDLNLHTLTEEEAVEIETYRRSLTIDERYTYYAEIEHTNAREIVAYVAQRFPPFERQIESDAARALARDVKTRRYRDAPDSLPIEGGDKMERPDVTEQASAIPTNTMRSDVKAPEPVVASSATNFEETRIADAEALAQVMYQPTEDNVALLFQKEYGHRLRYCKAWGWLIWDGARWRAEKTDAALDFCRDLARKVNQQGKSSIAKLSFARGVEAFARAARCFSTVPEDWDQDEFALNTPAGIVDLRTGLLRPHSGKEYVTKVTRVAPRPGPHPVFDSFMRQITLDDAALVSYHQRSLGATLSGARADHWLLFWIGAGRNGKNTLGELVEYILGDYAKTIQTETLMSAQTERHPTELANLRGLRLAISSEVSEGAHWNESRIKSLTGDASISARYMKADFFEFPRGHKHLVYGNHRPLLRVVDDAIRARMHCVPFKATFRDDLGNRDPRLQEKLRAEAPAILALLIEEHLQWVKDGYTLRKCAAVKLETDDYFASQSTPDLWIAECCELVPNDDRPTGSLEKASALYRSFANWKEARGENAMGQMRWGEWMARRFQKKTADGVRYRGIRLKLNEREMAYWQR